MGTYKKYIDDLEIQKNNLVTALNNKGVEATNTETLNTLVPKVNEIKIGSSTKQPLTAEYIKANWIPLTANANNRIYYKSSGVTTETPEEYIMITRHSGKMIAYCSEQAEALEQVQIIYPNINENMPSAFCFALASGDSTTCFSFEFDDLNCLCLNRDNTDLSDLSFYGSNFVVIPIHQGDTNNNNNNTSEYAYLNGLYLEP